MANAEKVKPRLIAEVSDQFHDNLKILCIKLGVSIRDFIIQAVKEKMARSVRGKK